MDAPHLIPHNNSHLQIGYCGETTPKHSRFIFRAELVAGKVEPLEGFEVGEILWELPEVVGGEVEVL